MPQELRKQATPYKPKKGESYMSSKQLMHFRNILEGIKVELGQDMIAQCIPCKTKPQFRRP